MSGATWCPDGRSLDRRDLAISSPVQIQMSDHVTDPLETNHVQATTVDDLFGEADDETHDPFSQLNDAVTSPLPKDSEIPDERPSDVEHQPSTMTNRDFSDLLAEFEAEQPLHPPSVDDAAPTVPAPAPSHEDVGVFSGEEDDFDNLLIAKSEEPPQEGVLNEGDEVEPARQATPDIAIAAAASGLFDASSEASPFDDLIAGNAPAHEEHEALGQGVSELRQVEIPSESLGFESTHHPVQGEGDISTQSLFSNNTDWLADTSMDESFDTEAIERSDDPTVRLDTEVEQMQMEKGDGSEPVSFEVPQGWFDDNGNWQWYTEEEKEQVRLAMLGQEGPNGQDANGESITGVPSVPSPGLLPSPSLPPMSENNARRTPVPESHANGSSVSSLYAPSSQPQTASTSGSYGGASSSSSLNPGYFPYAPAGPSQSSLYAPAASSQATSYVNQTPSYAPAPPAQASPYVPATQSQASPYDPPTQINPYAPSTSSPYSPSQQYGSGRSSMSSSATMSSLFPTPVPVSKPRAPAPQRMPSTAYDPPMLKAQKSFARSASTMAFSSPGFGLASPPQSHPPPPPTGPPRGAKTPGTDMSPPSLSPQNQQVDRRESVTYDDAQAIPAGPSRSPAQSTTSMPPMRPPSTSQTNQAGPPRSQTFSSFDPPMRPQSTSRSPNPPPPRVPSAAGTTLSPFHQASEPPRAVSRGSQRRTSPMFESRPTFDRPPSRPSSDARPPSRPATEARPPSRSVMEARPPSRSTMEARSPSRSTVEARPPSRPIMEAPPPSMNTYEARPSSHTTVQGGDPVQTVYQAVTPVNGLGLTTNEPEMHLQMGESSEQALDERHDEPFTRFSPQPPLPPVQPVHDPFNDQEQDQPKYDYSEGAFGKATSPGHDAYRATSPQHPSAPPMPQDNYSYDPYQPAPVPPANTNSYAPYNAMPSQQAPTQVNAPGFTHSSENYDPYAPGRNVISPPRPVNDQYRSNGYDGPAFGASPTKEMPTRAFSPPDPYAPTSYAPSSFAPPAPDNSNNGLAYASDLGVSPPRSNFFQSMTAPHDDTYTPQQVLEQRPVSEDPLQRCTIASRNMPLATFGFGGVLLTCFPGLAENEEAQDENGRAPMYGYASGRGRLHLRPIAEVASSSALKASDTPFPGPLILDPSMTKNAAGEKKKKETVIAYLKTRAEEIENGLPYLKTSASQTRREEEAKLVMTRLLSAMIEGNGKFTGSPQVEAALQDALVGPGDAAALPVAPAAANATSPLSPVKGFPAAYFNRLAAPAKASQAQIAELSSLLRTGSKREAVQTAAEAGLWSHALVISSSVDPELWRDVVLRFTAAELGPDGLHAAGMRASYTLFSGPASGSVEELFKAAHITSDPSTDQWREVLAAVVFSGKPADLFSLDEFAARLDGAGLISAAHACHLLSPTSPFSDNTPAAFDRLIALTQNPRDEDALIFAEVAEYARSLVPLPKGQDMAIFGLPQLLPYKLQRAWRAAELGDVDQAQRYCSAVGAAAKPLKNATPLLPLALLASLEDLTERLTGTPSAEPANLVMTGRKNKPGYSDKLGSWFEGRLTKFIAGDEDQATSPIKQSAPKSATKHTPRGPVGPFSHFSTISPAVSGQISRVPSGVDFPAMNGALGLQTDPLRTSPALLQGSWGQPLEPPSDSRSSSSSYGASYAPEESGWQGTQSQPDQNEVQLNGEDDEDGLLNPMAALRLGPKPDTSRVNYQPQPLNSLDDDDDDLGFSNSSLSRTRTPKPATDGGSSGSPSPEKPDEKNSKKEDPAKPGVKTEQKGSWLGRWWGKKEGEGGGPIRAKLGEESSMVFDPELKRWVVKGQKPEAAPAALPPPPSRAQTASPSKMTRADTGVGRPPSTGPASGPSGAMGPPSMSKIPRSVTAPMGFTQMPDGGIKRVKPSLEPIGGDEPPRQPSPSSSQTSSSSASASLAPPAGLPRSATGASLDDLLSRPPSKRPGSSAAKRSMKNRYVDVFQAGAGNPGDGQS